MAYGYKSRRAARKLARKSSRNFLITLFIIGLLVFISYKWLIPGLILTLGFVNNITNPPPKFETSTDSSLAPPVLNIPFEATNTAQINIKGYATPNSEVAIYIDGDLIDSVISAEDGSFEIQNVPLQFGTNEIFGKTLDEKGESLPSKTIKIIYDDEKPILEVFEPEDGKTQQGERKIKISGKTEPQAQVLVNDSRAPVSLDGNFSLDYSLNDGENILIIKAIDPAQNFEEIERRVTFTP